MTPTEVSEQSQSINFEMLAGKLTGPDRAIEIDSRYYVVANRRFNRSSKAHFIQITARDILGSSNPFEIRLDPETGNLANLDFEGPFNRDEDIAFFEALQNMPDGELGRVNIARAAVSSLLVRILPSRAVEIIRRKWRVFDRMKHGR